MKHSTNNVPLIRVFVALSTIALGGCATSFDTIVDYDDQVNFAEYRTFSWISEEPMVLAPRIAQATNPFMESRIQDAISTELSEQGYRFEPVGSDVDFVVAFSVAARKEMNVESYPYAYRGRWQWGYGNIGDSVSVRSTTEGMLSIDVFDGETRSPAWHGRATKNLTPADQQLRSSVITDAVQEILKNFPPAPR